MHSSFKLNGISFQSEKELIEFAKTISESLCTFLKDWFNKESFIVVTTSGSTGTPKPIQLKKKYMINSAKATGEFFNIKENTNALLCLSVDYIAGKMMLVRALTLGWNIDIIDPVSSPLTETNKTYDFSAMVPLQLQNSLQDLHRIKKLIVGGGVVSSVLIKQLQNISTKVYATYGMTETITHIAVKKLNNYKKTPVFYRTLPKVKIGIDHRDCLVIQAPKVSDELIVTNDVVQLISDKNFEWLGRFDNVINSGGIKLHPEKIEEKLAKIINRRFFVTGVSDTVLGEKLILVIEGENYDIKLDQLESLSKYEKPKEVYFVSDFIVTETKKIQRKKTIELLNL